MLNCRNYIVVNSLEEAYELNKKGSNRIIAGNAWLKMGAHPKDTLIDLSNLGLDKIEEMTDSFEIGAMVTLRALELNKSLNDYTNNAFKECLENIVGTQFRNCATIGGSIWGRFGFSDPLTLLLVLNAEVVLYKAGKLTLKDFSEMKYDNDILVKIIIKKQNIKVAYEAFRNQATDFPVLTAALCLADDKIRVAIGACPSCAKVFTFAKNSSIEEIVTKYNFASNMRASKEYRYELAKILVKHLKERIGNHEN